MENKNQKFESPIYIGNELNIDKIIVILFNYGVI